MSNSKPRVILFEETEFPVDGCVIYGDVAYICPKAIARPAVMETSELTEVIIERLEQLNYNKDVDYFVISGGLLPCIICTATIANEYGQFNALVYDKRNRSYTSRRLG